MTFHLDRVHIRLPHLHSGRARLQGGRSPSAQTKANKENPEGHAAFLRGKSTNLNDFWRREREERANEGLPDVPNEIPLLIKVDPGFNIDALRTAFDFELVSEFEEGYLIVAAEDLDFTKLLDTANKLASGQKGGGNAASIHDLSDETDQLSRLKRILSDDLFAAWEQLEDDTVYVVDVGVECLGKVKVPAQPERTERDTEVTYAAKMARYRDKLFQVYQEWDDLRIERETSLGTFVQGYAGEIGSIIDGEVKGIFELSDSFTARIQLNGKGLRDLAINFPFIFEISTPDKISKPIFTVQGPEGALETQFEEPEPHAPSVCVIDSGIQQNHPLLVDAIRVEDSFCYISNSTTTVADLVAPNGHGTRVAGAVLFPKGIPRTGIHQHKCFIQNARILDQYNGLPSALFPPDVIRDIVERFNSENRRNTKIFNHSISANRPCSLKQMSHWAAALDLLSYERDILFVQCTGNLPEDSPDIIQRGVLQHIQNGDDYPSYLLKKSSRIANPSQSMSSLTVGSVAINLWTDGTRTSFADRVHSPSSFTRTGLGIWGDIKPEVVELGGDTARDTGNPPSFSTPPEVCTELVRAINGMGPHFSSDEVGTSYATPKVASLAADLQKILPDQPALLYKALIVQSARWPSWALNDIQANWLNYFRYFGYGLPSMERALMNSLHRITLFMNGESRIKAREVHIYNVPIPDSISSQANEQDILVEVTLTYVGKPRRTRRTPRGYYGIWVDWITSKKNEGRESFLGRSSSDFQQDNDADSAIPWVLGMKTGNEGLVNGVRRNLGATQKDWAIVKAHELPNSFCIAVRGHEGWDSEPEGYSKYSLVVSFEALNSDLEIYNPIKVEIDNLEVRVDNLEV